MLKPTDKVSLGLMTKLPVATCVNAEQASLKTGYVSDDLFGVVTPECFN